MSNRKDALVVLETSRRVAARSPADFRRLAIHSEGGSPISRSLTSWQSADHAALDPAWASLAGKSFDATQPFRRRAYIERPRGHSKTTDTAVQLAWILLAADRGLNGLAAAADREQAALIHAAVKRLAQANPALLSRLSFVEHEIRNSRTGSLLRVISSDVRGSWGALPDFVVCDELCHWRSPELWQSLLSSAAKRPQAVLIVLSNAGFGRGWVWDVREAARIDPAWHFSTLDGPQASWITPESLAEQRRLLPPGVFARLWLNQWQQSDGEFVSLSEAAACSDDHLTERVRGQPPTRYVAAIDYAEKRDLTVGCVAHRDGDLVIVDRMDVVRPSPGRMTPVDWVADWIETIAERFGDVEFVIDEYQLAGTIQTLERRHRIERFQFLGGAANHQMALLLRQLILSQRVRWYAGCGIPAGEEERLPPDTLESELASLIVQQQASGRLRFNHVSDGRHHDDRSFALGVACLKLMENPAAEADLLALSPPRADGTMML